MGRKRQTRLGKKSCLSKSKESDDIFCFKGFGSYVILSFANLREYSTMLNKTE
jgi:hypothetical protein